MGFPNPAKDFMQPSIDFHRDCLTNPDKTIYKRVTNNSLSKEGINEGDILVIDQVAKPKTGQLIACHIGGELSVVRLNEHCAQELEFVGVITYIFRKVFNENAVKLKENWKLFSSEPYR